MFCGNCGARLEDGARFCPECGTAVNQSEEAVKAEEAPKAEAPVQEAKTESVKAEEAPKVEAPAQEAKPEPVKAEEAPKAEASVQEAKTEPVKAEEAPKAEASAQEAKPEPVKAEEAPKAEAPAQEVKTEPVKEKKVKKGGKGKLIAVLVVVVLLLAGAGGGFAFYMSPAQQYSRAMKKGDGLMEEKAYQQAIEAYLLAYDIDDSKEVKKALTKAYLKYADECLDTKDYETAISTYQEVQELDSKNEDATAGMIKAYLGAGADSFAKEDYEKAKSYYDEVLKLDEYNEEATGGSVDCQAGLGKAALAAGDTEKARDYFNEVLAYDYTNPIACSGMAQLMAEDGDVTGALNYLEESLWENEGNEDLLAEQNYLIENSYKASMTSTYDDGSSYYTEYYEDSEQIKHSIGYDRYGNISYEMEYDEQGNVISSKEYEYGSLASETAYTYNSDNLVLKTEFVSYVYPEETSTTENVYDGNGNMTQSVSRDVDGNITYSFEAEYDAAGNEIREVTKTPDYETGEITQESVCEYTYDEHNQMLQSYYYVNSYTEGITYEYVTNYEREYDAQGNMISCKTTYPDDVGYYVEETYQYDASGNITYQTYYEVNIDDYGTITNSSYTETTRQYYADGTESYIESYTEYTGYYSSGTTRSITEYDEKGRAVSGKTISDDTNISTYTYTYDEHDNQIQYAVNDSNRGYQEYNSTYEYDAFGNVVYSNNSYGTSVRYTYEYKLK